MPGQNGARRMAVDLLGGRADKPHEQGHRVAPAAFGQGLPAA
jgi:hypothetical protein